MTQTDAENRVKVKLCVIDYSKGQPHTHNINTHPDFSFGILPFAVMKSDDFHHNILKSYHNFSCYNL